MEEWQKNVMEIVRSALCKINEHATKSDKEIAETTGEEFTGPQVGFLEIEALAQPAEKALEALEILMYGNADLSAFNDNYRDLAEALGRLYDTGEYSDDTPFPIE